MSDAEHRAWPQAPGLAFHESPLPNRSMAFLLAGVCGLGALWAGWNELPSWAALATLGAGVFCLIGSFWAARMAPLTRGWLRFAQVLAGVISPLVMLILYIFALMPFALIHKLSRKGDLGETPAPGSQSYWVERSTPSPDTDSLRRPF